MLRLRLTEIPRQGLEIDSEISAEALNERLAHGADSDVRVLENPKFKVRILLERDSSEAGASLEGSLTASLEQLCRRCIEPMPSEVTIPVQYILKPVHSNKKKDEDVFEEDLGVALYQGDWIELEELLQETLILSIDPLGVKHEDCLLPDGRRPEDEPESGAPLGDFFAKAKQRKKS